jgi:dTDP-4-dehydrorhamnose 3,5-epimerase
LIIEPLQIAGCFAIKPHRKIDGRGYFEKDYSEKFFEESGLNIKWVQENTSYSELRGTVRGLHIQVSGKGEIKRIKCLRGQVFEVFLDLRHKSPTFCQWGSYILTEDSGEQIYLAEGIAHGFQTLTDGVLLQYSHNVEYQPLAAKSVNFADSDLEITWPHVISNVSQSDKCAPSLKEFVKNYVL